MSIYWVLALCFHGLFVISGIATCVVGNMYLSNNKAFYSDLHNNLFILTVLSGVTTLVLYVVAFIG